MTVCNVGIRSGNTVVPYASAQKRTKEVTLTVTGTNWTTARAKAIFYADSAGVWRMRFNIGGSISTATASLTLTISNIVFVSGVNQACCAYDIYNDNNWSSARASNGGNTILIRANAVSEYLGCSGDVELASEPTTYTTAANMEGVVAAVYIAPASATVDGIVDRSAQTFAGVKTFNSGVVLGAGNETLSVYDEGTWTPAEQTKANLTGTSSFGTATYTRIGNRVFATLSSISGLTLTTAGAETFILLTTTGLPSVTNTTQFYGGASVAVGSSPYEVLPTNLTDGSASNTYLFLGFGSTSGLGVSNGDGLTINSVHFSYII